jgi:hypothetical protein
MTSSALGTTDIGSNGVLIPNDQGNHVEVHHAVIGRS